MAKQMTWWLVAIARWPIALVVVCLFVCLATAQFSFVVDFHRHDKYLAFAYSRDGRLLAGGGYGDSILVWDARTGNSLRAFEIPNLAYCRSLTFSPDGSQLVGSGDDGFVRFWNVRTGVLERRLAVSVKPVTCIAAMAFSSDGRYLAVAGQVTESQNRVFEVSFLDLTTGKARWTWQAPLEKHVASVSFSADGKSLAATDGHVHFFDAETGTLVKSLHVEGCAFLDAAFRPDSTTPAGVEDDLRKILRLGELRALLCMTYSPDGRYVAVSGDGPGTVRLRNGDNRIKTIVQIWDANTGKLSRTIANQMSYRQPIAFSPDGKSLLSCDGDCLSLYEISTGLRRLELSSEPPLVRPAADSQTKPREEFDLWWAELSSADGVRAYRAMRQFAMFNEETAAYLRRRLRPMAAQPRERIAQLIGKLGSDKFVERDDASRQLDDLRDLAEEELAKAQAAQPELEVRRRIERLLEKRDLLKSPERLQTFRAIEILETIGTAEARGVLQKLADGAAEAQQTKEARASVRRLAMRTKPGF
jgi:hypothetical protein